MFVRMIEEMRFCWVGSRAISILTIVLQCLDKWILVMCNYWFDEACSKCLDLCGESDNSMSAKIIADFH